MPKHPLRFGLQTGQQLVEWKDLKELWRNADSWGYDSLWTYDHFYPIFVPDPTRQCLEGWTTLHRAESADETRAHRRDGERQHVSQPMHHGEDGGDARPRQRRPSQFRHWRRLVRPRASKFWNRLRTLFPDGCRRSTNRSTSSRGCSSRKKLHCTDATTT